MLNITPQALEFIRQQIIKNNDGSIFHLSIKRTGCSGWMYVPNIIKEPKPTDIHVHNLNELDIYISNDHQEFLKDTKVDLETKELGFKQLVFQNPKATSECGCGESFIIDEIQND